MTIRAYQPSDRNECIDIFTSNVPLFFAPDELPLLENWLNGQDAGKLTYTSNLAEQFYVITMNDKVMGCGGFYIPANGQNANMTWGMVHKTLHKQGIGRILLEFRIQTIKTLYPGYAIVLDTSQHSYKFFEQFGFTVTKITNDAYGPGLNRYDMVIR